MKKRKNVGLWADRFGKGRDNPREVAFAEQWEEENEWHTRRAYILSTLLYGHGHGPESACVAALCNRRTLDPSTLEHDRIVAATIVQWLGSNVGFSFLEEALRRCGYRIVRSAEGKRS